MDRMDKHLNLNVTDSVKFTKRPTPVNHSHASQKTMDQVRQAVLKNKQLQIKKQRKKSKPPVKLIASCVTLLALAIIAHFNHDELDKLLSRVEIGVFSQGLAQAEKSAAPQAKTGNNAPTNKGTAAAEKPKEKTSWTAEEINIFKGLDDRKKQLDERERNLNVLAEELQKQRSELDGKLKKLEEVRANISQTLGEQVEKDEEKLGKLVEVYSNMKPNNAAKVFENIDENLAVDILTRMKKDRAANVLNLIEPAKARRLSEKFAGYVRK